MNGEDIKAGEHYRLLPRPDSMGGACYPFIGEDAVTDGYGTGWAVGAKLSAYRDGVDADNDARMFVTGVEGGPRQYVGANVLEPWTDEPEAVKADAVGIVNIDDAWKPGNMIEFTATGVVSGTSLEVGCKTIPLATGLTDGVIQSVTKRDGAGVDVVIRGTVESSSSWLSEGVLEYTPTGLGRRVTVTKDEARVNGRDFKVVAKLVETKPDVTATLTYAEVDALAAIRGKISGTVDGPRGLVESGIEKLIDAAGIASYDQSTVYSKAAGNLRFNR